MSTRSVFHRCQTRVRLSSSIRYIWYRSINSAQRLVVSPRGPEEGSAEELHPDEQKAAWKLSQRRRRNTLQARHPSFVNLHMLMPGRLQRAPLSEPRAASKIGARVIALRRR